MSRPASDQLRITGIECHAHHGLFESERLTGQRFVVDLVLGLDTARAARTGALEDTVDYGGLVVSVRDSVEADPVDLIETVAQRVADVCLGDTSVEWVEVTLHKPDAPIPATFHDVAVRILRRRDAPDNQKGPGNP